MREMVSIKEAVKRCVAEGVPVSEYSLRLWIKQGKLRCVYAGTKALIYFPTLRAYLTGQEVLTSSSHAGQ